MAEGNVDLVEELRYTLAAALRDAELPPMLASLARAALVELEAWTRGASVRGLRIAEFAARECRAFVADRGARG